LAARPNHFEKGRLAVLAAGGEALLRQPNEDGEARWGAKGKERDVKLLVRRLSPLLSDAGDEAESETGAEKTTQAYQTVGPQEFPAATASPSSLSGEGRVVETHSLGERISISVSGEDGMRHFGEAVHAFLAADRLTYPPDERLAMAEGLLTRWGVSGAVEAGELLGASERLSEWIQTRWPGARWRREWPVEQRLPGGTILRGTADLVLETEAGFVVIDHKSFPGSREQAELRAVEYAGQLSAYAGVVGSASGQSHLGSYIHLPVSGLMVQVEVK
jgi:hypothetical protein